MLFIPSTVLLHSFQTALAGTVHVQINLPWVGNRAYAMAMRA